LTESNSRLFYGQVLSSYNISRSDKFARFVREDICKGWVVLC
jgi:hypothetical protein